MFRRRPLMRAAVVGGGAYVAGKKVAQSKQHTADQDAQLAAQQQQQQAPQAAPAESQDDKMAQLKQLKELLDSGVLTQAEFDAQKQKILQSM
jgi:membrane protease subunit (stomatin/prohibitin family)